MIAALPARSAFHAFETLKCYGARVFTLNDSTAVCRVSCSEDAFSDDDARAYAALFSMAPTLFNAAHQVASLFRANTNYHATPSLDPLAAAMDTLIGALAACTPRPKGDVFKRGRENDIKARVEEALARGPIDSIAAISTPLTTGAPMRVSEESGGSAGSAPIVTEIADDSLLVEEMPRAIAKTIQRFGAEATL